MNLKTIIEEAKKKLIFPYKNAPVVTMNGEEPLTIDVVKLEKCITKAVEAAFKEIMVKQSFVAKWSRHLGDEEIKAVNEAMLQWGDELQQKINKFINE